MTNPAPRPSGEAPPTEEPLDDETELLMWEYRVAGAWSATIRAQNALRSRIRLLVEEARFVAIQQALDPDGAGRAHLNTRI